MADGDHDNLPSGDHMHFQTKVLAFVQNSSVVANMMGVINFHGIKARQNNI